MICTRMITCYVLVFFLGIAPSVLAGNAGERDYFKRAIKRNPADLQAHINYQQIMLEMGKRQSLKEEYGQWMRNEPDSGLFLYLYGRLLQNPDQQHIYFYRAIEADSTLFQAHFDLGKMHYARGEYNEAIARYRMASRLRPESAVIFNLLGLAYYHRGHPDQAIAEYQRAIANDSSYADAYLNLGLAYYYTDQFDKAIATYLQARDRAKWNDDVHLLYHNLGMAYRQQGDIEKSAKAYRKALQHKPDYAEAYISLGNLALYQDDYAQAIENFEKALGSESENADLHLRLGLSYFNSQNYPKAIVHFQQTVQRDSTELQTYHYLGQAYYLNNQPDQAIQALETFVAKEKRKRARVAEAKQLIFDIKKERFTNLLK